MFAVLRYDICAGKWCTVTDGEGPRYSPDVNVDSSYDAAHLNLRHCARTPVLRLADPDDGDGIRDS